MITGGINFTTWKWVLKEAVKELDPATGEMVEVLPEVAVNFGNTIAIILDFIIIAFAIFCMIKALNKLQRKKEEAPPAPPAPSNEEVLLTEIRDLLKERK